MRVSQLARKLNILPADVLAALPKGSLEGEGAHNARLSDAQVEEVVRFFRPGQWHTILNEIRAVESAELPEPPSADTPSEKEASVEAATDTKNADTPAPTPETPQDEQAVEVIRAPKIELPGLRVVGKIEIPEKKKPEPRPSQEQAAQKHTPAQITRRERPAQGRQQRKKTSPTEIREAERRQQQKRAELEKQKRTERYLKKVAARKARQEQKLRSKNTTQQPEALVQPPAAQQAQLSWWQRFKRWLFRE
jgi:hypothetical protein